MNTKTNKHHECHSFCGRVVSAKKGVCIGSSAAPLLAELYLERVDNYLAQVYSRDSVYCARYVDDILLVGSSPDILNRIVQNIKEHFLDLSFQVEKLPNGCLLPSLT